MARLCTDDTSTSTTSVLVQLIGLEATQRITETFGGEVLYIPRKIKDGRNEIIKREFRDMLSGGGTCMSSYRSLARKHDLSPGRIMAIVNH